MRCLSCNYDSRYKERIRGQCPKCKQAFAFEPARKDIMTDVAFQRCIDVVSSQGSVRWGIEHLYYEVCRRKAHWTPGCLGFGTMAVLLALFAGSYYLRDDPLLGWVALAIALALAWGLVVTRRPRRKLSVDLKTFNRMWHQWQGAHGLPESVIIRRSPQALAQQHEGGHDNESDLADYSFDRVVVCDRARTVDLLLANNFHFEHNCAVISHQGYPPHAFDTVRKMLKRNPRLEVYVLHDATYTGCSLARRLAEDPQWFPGFAITDVGLQPRHARRHRALLTKPARSVALADRSLSAHDASWLAKYALELAALRPQQIILAVFRAMNRPDSSGSSDSGGDGGDDEFEWEFDGDGDNHDSFG